MTPKMTHKKLDANSYIAQLEASEFSFSEAVGGWRGVIETTLPGAVFVIVYIITYSLIPPLVAASVCAIIAAIMRLIHKGSLKQVLVGVLGVAIGVVWALSTGKAEDFFALGLWINAVYGVVVLATIIFRFPAIGFFAAALSQSLSSWRTKEGVYKEFYKRSVWATWVWVGVFAVRLIIEVPLYYAELVSALGIARLILGVPLFAVGAWLTWVLMKDIFTQVKNQANRQSS